MRVLVKSWITAGHQLHHQVCLQVWRRFKDNEEVWSKAYLPAERTTKSRGNYEGKVTVRHVQIKLVVV